MLVPSVTRMIVATMPGYRRMCPARLMVRSVDPRDRLSWMGKRLTDPAEVLAQRITERVVAHLVEAIDINAILGRVDVNALLDRVDVDALLDRVDVDRLVQRTDLTALADRLDVNSLVKRIDMDALVEQTDLGAILARSSGGVLSEALDALRSQAVGLDWFVDRWVRRLLRQKRPGPVAPGPSAATAGP